MTNIFMLLMTSITGFASSQLKWLPRHFLSSMTLGRIEVHCTVTYLDYLYILVF